MSKNIGQLHVTIRAATVRERPCGNGGWRGTAPVAPLRSRLRFIVLILALAWGGACRVACAANELGPGGEVINGAGAEDAADESNKYLGSVYKDEVAGIVIAPPAGSRVVARAGRELMSFVNEAKQWVGSVQSLTLKDKMDVKQYMQQSVDALNKEFRGVQIDDRKEIQFQTFEAGRLTTKFSGGEGGKGQTGKITLYRQDLVVRTGDNQFMLLTMYTPLKDRAEAEKTFDAMIKSFVILDKKVVAEKRYAASLLGKKWLADRSAEELKTKLSSTPQVFRIQVGGMGGKPGSDVGFVRFDAMEKQQKEGPGVMLVVSTRTWPADGAVQGANIAFWRYKRDGKEDRPGYSTWENSTKYLKRGENLPGGKYTFWYTEFGILMEEGNTRLDEATLKELQKEREDLLQRRDIPADRIPPAIEPIQKMNHLIVSYAGDPTQGFNDPNKGTDVRIPEIRPAVLPKILEYTWTRVVDLSKPSEMLFVVYNSATRKLAMRTFSVVGPSVITLDGRSVSCVKCTDEMESASTTLWVDGSGKVLKMLTSDQSMLSSAAWDDVAKMWRTREEFGVWERGAGTGMGVEGGGGGRGGPSLGGLL